MDISNIGETAERLFIGRFRRKSALGLDLFFFFDTISGQCGNQRLKGCLVSL